MCQNANQSWTYVTVMTKPKFLLRRFFASDLCRVNSVPLKYILAGIWSACCAKFAHDNSLSGHVLFVCVALEESALVCHFLVGWEIYHNP